MNFAPQRRQKLHCLPWRVYLPHRLHMRLRRLQGIRLQKLYYEMYPWNCVYMHTYEKATVVTTTLAELKLHLEPKQHQSCKIILIMKL